MTRREDGAVLLVVLVALALLAAMTGVAMRLGQSGLQGLAAERAEAARGVLLQSALAVLGVRLADLDFPRDGTPLVLDLPEGRVEAQVQSAEGLVNPSHAPLELLLALLETQGATAEQALPLAASVVQARAAGPFSGPEDVAPLFGADPALWRKLAPFLTYLGTAQAIDPSTAPEALMPVLARVGPAGVDLGGVAAQKGFYEIGLRVLAPDETPATAKGFISHYAVLHDRMGDMHVLTAGWPQEPMQ